MAEKIDVAETLKERFEAAGLWHLETADTCDGKLTDRCRGLSPVN